MRLSKNWKRVLRHAWSIRLLALTIFLTLLEGFVALAGQLLGLPFWLHATIIIVTPLVGLAAMFARITFQKEFEDGE